MKTFTKFLASAFAALAIALPVTQAAQAAPVAQPVQVAIVAAGGGNAVQPAGGAADKNKGTFSSMRSKRKLPARDAKGRFIKRPKPSASKKPLPPRDAKGRFTKPGAKPGAKPVAKATAKPKK